MFVSQIYDEIAEILGTTDKSKIFRKLTQAVQTLMESGHWFHTNAEVDVCTGWDGVTVTLPRNVEIPLAVNIDGSPLYFRDRMFQYHVNKGGVYNTVDWAWDDRGYHALMMDITRPSQLVAIAESSNDAGKFLRVLGVDKWGRTLRSQLDDGTGVDGLLIPVHGQGDFNYGTITPDGNTVSTREISVTPMTQFTTATPHFLSSGVGMQLSAPAGTIPLPLGNGNTYYVGVLDAYTIQLYSDSLNALSNQYPLSLQDVTGFQSLQLTDSRPSKVVTALKLASPPAISLTTGNGVTFRNGQTLPSPIERGTTYFANQLSSDTLQIFSSLSDAQNNTNQVNVTGTTASVEIDLRKPFSPDTKITFTVNHYFSPGDQVQASNSGGSLPQPLLPNQNYYVGVIDEKTVSLYLSASDVLTNNNPINLISEGSGSNALVKIIPATAQLGGSSNIVVTGTNFDAATGSGAVAFACPSGPVTSFNVVPGNGYVNQPVVTISDVGGRGYPVSGTTVSFIGNATTSAQATANVDAGTGRITSITVNNAGSGYSVAPKVFINSTNNAGKGAVAIATLNGSGGVATVILQPVGSGASVPSVILGTVSGSGGNIGTILGVGTNATFGSGYEINPYVTITDASGGSGATPGTVTITSNVIQSIAVATQGSGYTTAPSVLITGGGGSGATARAVLTGNQVTSIVVDNGGSGYTSTPSVYIGGSGGSISATVTTSFIGRYNISNITPASGGSSGGSGSDYSYFPLISVVGGGGSGATALATPDPVSKRIVSITPVTQGSGYILVPTVTITPQTNNFIQFTSTGALPAPLVSGVSYLIGNPSIAANGNQTFTVLQADGTPVNITSLGNGNFYVAISRTFGVGWTGNWSGDFSGLVTGQKFYFGTDYLLPSGSVGQAGGGSAAAGIDNGVTPFYLRISQNFSGQLTQAQVYTSEAQAIAGGSVGKVTVSGFGTGQIYYAIRFAANFLPYENYIYPDSVQYLKEGQTVTFTTTGTLPSPLTAGTNYQIRPDGDYFKVLSNNTVVLLTTTGSGQLFTSIVRAISPTIASTLTANSSLYETGTEVVPRPKVGDSLPNGLSEGTSYFVRRVDNNSFELYNSYANAVNLTSSEGKVYYRTTGDTLSSTFYVDSLESITFVKNVTQVDKPVTEGYVSLYAYDYGRSNDMTLIGQYHPSETNPQYRRIRVGRACSWARILYRVQAPKITSIYDFIPLENERALITAVHACDLEDKDFAEQATRYWGLAFRYLSSQQESMTGHAMQAPQINNLTYGDKTDVVMF
jgi:hypothetical protein